MKKIILTKRWRIGIMITVMAVISGVIPFLAYGIATGDWQGSLLIGLSVAAILLLILLIACAANAGLEWAMRGEDRREKPPF